MTRAEADKLAVILGNAYGVAINDLLEMLNEAGLGFQWTRRGEPPPRFESPPGGGPAFTFAELPEGDVIVVDEHDRPGPA